MTGTHGGEWDSCELVRAGAVDGKRLPLLVDQGEADEFVTTQLRPELLEAACQQASHPLVLRRHAGHDHSYYFIASFIGEHIAYHAAALAPR
jgi:S-formylglutathione hydrolase